MHAYSGPELVEVRVRRGRHAMLTMRIYLVRECDPISTAEHTIDASARHASKVSGNRCGWHSIEPSGCCH